MPERITSHLEKTIKDKTVLLVDWWFAPKNFESKKLYEAIGVKVFKKYAPTTGDLMNKHFWSKFFPEDIVEPNEKSAKLFKEMTHASEAVHILGFAAMNGFAAGALITNNKELALIIIGANTFINIYPVMLQRYNRLRINRVLAKFEERKHKR